MAYGKVTLIKDDMKDGQEDVYFYFVEYGRTPAGSGIVKNWHYHNKRLVFDVGALYYRNIHKIEVRE